MPRSDLRTDRRGEIRITAVVAVLVAVALQSLLPSRLVLGPRLALPTLEVLLLIPLVIANPVRLSKQTRWTRAVALALSVLILVANAVVLVSLVQALLDGKAKDGTELLLAALQVWLTNIIAYGLLFWELDRGGPVVRVHQPRAKFPQADFRFPQDEDHDAIVEVAAGSSDKDDWVPTLVDYLYISLTNSSAFSPTDTMPLSSRVKILMGIESSSALVLSLLVVSRAVSQLQ